MNRIQKRATRRGFTLVELMTATALTLIVMTILARVFVGVTDSITRSRATIEMNGRLQAVAFRLQKDLEGYTVNPDPLRENFNDGYLEIIEGPIRTGTLRISGITNKSNAYYGMVTSASRINSNSVTPYTRLQSAFPNANNYYPDCTLGDRDDILALTTRSVREPFVGRFGQYNGVPNTVTSEVAEVVWFLRGTTLYRRQLLVHAPTIDSPGSTSPAPGVAWWTAGGRYVRGGNFSNIQVFSNNSQNTWSGMPWEAYCDISAHYERNGTLVPNTLADLSRRQYRYGRNPDPNINSKYGAYPFDVRGWGALRMPTLAETSAGNFPYMNITLNSAGYPTGYPTENKWDRQLAPNSIAGVNVDPTTGWAQNGPRAGEDVVLTNVIGFDVKVWDPGAPVFIRNSGNPNLNLDDAILPGDPLYPQRPQNTGLKLAGYGAFVDLGYAPSYNNSGLVPSHFCSNGIGAQARNWPPDPNTSRDLPNSGLSAFGPPNSFPQCVWDSWTDWYEHDGIAQSGGTGRVPDGGHNGIDDDGKTGADDAGELDAPPPYPFRLRGVQVLVRVIDPDTDQIRQISIVQDFILE